MHEKYTTRGLIVSASAYREADKILSIYTEDFGLVTAVAAGVRHSASKLRYHTQDLSMRDFTLVQGRDIWRLVGAEEIEGITALESAESNGEALAAYARVLSLIRRLVRGEEKNEPVFMTLFCLHRLLVEEKRSEIDISAIETLAVFRILYALGYIKSDATTEALVVPLMMDIDLVATAKPLVPQLIFAINKGLTESHL